MFLLVLSIHNSLNDEVRGQGNTTLDPRELSLGIEFCDKFVDRRITKIITRSETRPMPVANGWAGAEMRFFSLFDSITMTNGPTDGRTKPLIESLVRD